MVFWKYNFCLFPLFIFGCVGSSLPCGLFSSCSAQVSDCSGFSVAAHRLWMHGLQQLWHLASAVVVPRPQSTGSIVVAHRFSCSVASGIFLDQGSNPCLLHWQVDSLPPGKPPVTFYNWKFVPLDSLTYCPLAHLCNHQSVFCIYELCFCLYFKDSTCK